MREKSNTFGQVLTYGWAGLAVGLLLLGRWTPDRLFADAAMGELFWLLKGAALLVLAVITGLPDPTGRRDRSVPAVGAFLVLMAYTLASYLWNPAPSLYADTKIVDLAYNTALVLAVALGLSRPTLRSAFWLVLLVALGAMALLGIATIPTAVATYDQGRLAVLGGGPNIFGRNMGVLLVACLYFAINHARGRILLAGLAAADAIGLIASGSRGAVAATLAALIVQFAVDPASRRFVLTRPLLLVGFALIGGGVLLITDLGSVAEVGSERFLEQTLEGRYLSYRDVLLQYAYDFWLEAPWFGNGLGSFSLVTPLDYPHNILAEFLCETGVVGLVLFLIYAGTAGAAQAFRGAEERALVIALIALTGVSALASGDFVDFRFLFLFLLFPVAADQRLRVTFRSGAREFWGLRPPR